MLNGALGEQGWGKGQGEITLTVSRLNSSLKPLMKSVSNLYDSHGSVMEVTNTVSIWSNLSAEYGITQFPNQTQCKVSKVK